MSRTKEDTGLGSRQDAALLWQIAKRLLRIWACQPGVKTAGCTPTERYRNLRSGLLYEYVHQQLMLRDETFLSGKNLLETLLSGTVYARRPEARQNQQEG